MTGDGLADIERARNIGGEQLLPFLDRKILERRAELHAGIVDQDIDRAGILLDRLDAVLGAWACVYVKAGHRHLVPGTLPGLSSTFRFRVSIPWQSRLLAT